MLLWAYWCAPERELAIRVYWCAQELAIRVLADLMFVGLLMHTGAGHPCAGWPDVCGLIDAHRSWPSVCWLTWCLWAYWCAQELAIRVLADLMFVGLLMRTGAGRPCAGWPDVCGLIDAHRSWPSVCWLTWCLWAYWGAQLAIGRENRFFMMQILASPWTKLRACLHRSVRSVVGLGVGLSDAHGRPLADCPWHRSVGLVMSTVVRGMTELTQWVWSYWCAQDLVIRVLADTSLWAYIIGGHQWDGRLKAYRCAQDLAIRGPA
jgi:hypothetical protein